MTNKKIQLAILIISLFAWSYLGYYDWKLALSIFFILSANNIEIKNK